MRVLNQTEVHAVSGGANPLEIGLALLAAPIMAVFLQQQLRDHAGSNKSYFEVLGMMISSLFTNN